MSQVRLPQTAWVEKLNRVLRSLKSHLWNHFLDINILMQKCLNLINTCCGNNKMMLSRMRDATAELVSFHNGSSDSFQTWCVSGRGLPLHGWKSRIWISWCVERLQPYKRRCTTGGNFKYKTICKKWINTITDSFCWDCQRNTTQSLLDSCESAESNDVYRVMASGSVSVPHQKNVRCGPSKIHRAKGAHLCSQTPPFNFHTDVWAVSVFVIILTYNL